MKGNLESRDSATGQVSVAAYAASARQPPPLTLKRLTDVVICLILLVVLAPVLLLVMVTVKCTSPGPILFRQQRVGRGGQLFCMYKFRTMYADADTGVHRAYARDVIRGVARPNGSMFKLTGDPRVTPPGQILRRTSLDELPQLVNVLLGDMSLVGPRPPLPYEADLYGPKEWRRQSVAPGITGLWQVSGRNVLTFQEMIDLDLHYVEHHSFWFDLHIIVRTFLVVLACRDGA